MPPSPLWKRRKAVRTYGRPSRSRPDSFKVFQDVIDEEGAEKKGREQSGYGRSSQATTLDSPHTEQQAFISTSPDADDPFADLASPITHRLKPSPIYLQGYRALAEKSTNHPILTRSATSTGVTYTPRLTLDTKPPPRPRKCRHAEPTLEDQDYLTILSPSKARNLDSKSHLRRYPGVPESGSDRPYNEPPALLGITSADMSDNVSTVSGTWVRERAKDIFSGTKKATEKIFGIAPPSARYKSQQQKGQRHKLKDMIKTGTKRGLDEVAANKKPEEMLEEKMRNRVTCKSVVPGINEDTVSLQGFLQDPFSRPEDYENNHSMDIGEEEDDPFGSYKTARPSRQGRLWRSESTQDLLKLGSAKMKNSEKERSYDSRYRTEDEDLNSFLATNNISPGYVYDFLHSQSDNEMPSSSPMFQSTPKKEWDYSKANFNSFGFDTDSIEDMAMGELLDGGSGGYDESNRDRKSVEFSAENITSGAWGCQGEVKVTTGYRENRHLVLRAAGSEDELCDAPYDMESSKIGNEKGYVGMSIDGGSDNKKDKKALGVTVFARTNDRGLKEGANQKQKKSRDSIHAGGSRMSKNAPKDRNYTRVIAKEGAVGLGSGGNRMAVPRIAPKKSSSGGVSRGAVKKGIKKRMSFRGYEQIEVDDEVDELQMDLPAMMI